MTKDKLKNSWWYRLLQIIFIIFFLIAIFIAVVISSDYKPYLIAGQSKYNFQCHGSEILRGDVPGDKMYELNSVIKFICDNQNLLDSDSDYMPLYREAIKQNNIPRFDNFEYVLKDGVYSGTWNEYCYWLVGSIFVVIIIFILLRLIFFYIVIGAEAFDEYKKIFIKIKNL